MLNSKTPADQDRPAPVRRNTSVLGTASEGRFDRITRLARNVFDVPIAMVSLADSDRKWFQARRSGDGVEISREVSF